MYTVIDLKGRIQGQYIFKEDALLTTRTSKNRLLVLGHLKIYSHYELLDEDRISITEFCTLKECLMGARRDESVLFINPVYYDLST